MDYIVHCRKIDIRLETIAKCCNICACGDLHKAENCEVKSCPLHRFRNGSRDYFLTSLELAIEEYCSWCSGSKQFNEDQPSCEKCAIYKFINRKPFSA